MSAGLKYITDDSGNVVSVILNIAEYQKILEDIEDLRVIAERKNENSIPAKDVSKETIRVRHRKEVYQK